ncbi:MAG: hypothetical protein MZV70_69810 [Desulfobacterales bacterium]|nr:hypothetical protein [Desulfobacterales bacterium]
MRALRAVLHPAAAGQRHRAPELPLLGPLGLRPAPPVPADPGPARSRGPSGSKPRPWRPVSRGKSGSPIPRSCPPSLLLLRRVFDASLPAIREGSRPGGLDRGQPLGPGVRRLPGAQGGARREVLEGLARAPGSRRPGDRGPLGRERPAGRAPLPRLGPASLRGAVLLGLPGPGGSGHRPEGGPPHPDERRLRGRLGPPPLVPHGPDSRGAPGHVLPAGSELGLPDLRLGSPWPGRAIPSGPAGSGRRPSSTAPTASTTCWASSGSGPSRSGRNPGTWAPSSRAPGSPGPSWGPPGFPTTGSAGFSEPHVREAGLLEAAGRDAMAGGAPDSGGAGGAARLAGRAAGVLLDRIGSEPLFLFKPSVRGEKDIRTAVPTEALRGFLLAAWRDRALIPLGPDSFAPAWRHYAASAWPSLSDPERGALEGDDPGQGRRVRAGVGGTRPPPAFGAQGRGGHAALRGGSGSRSPLRAPDAGGSRHPGPADTPLDPPLGRARGSLRGAPGLREAHGLRSLGARHLDDAGLVGARSRRRGP